MARLARLWPALRRRLEETRRIWGPRMAHGCIDLPEAGGRVDARLLEVSGWALLRSGPPVRVEVWLDDLSLGPARLGMPRPDVRQGSTAPGAGICGFELSADLSGFEPPKRTAELRVVATGPGGETLALAPVPLRIGPAGLGSGAPPSRSRVLPAPRPRTPHAPERPGHRLLAFTHRLDLGGAQLYLLELIRELLLLEAANPTVVTSVDGPLRLELEELGVPVHVSSPVPGYDRGAHLGRIEELVVWAEGRGFDMAFVNTVSSYAFPGAEVAGRLGIPALWAVHESYRPCELWSDLTPEVFALAEDALAAASLAIFETESTQRLYEQRLPGRCLTLPYGVALDAIDGVRASFDRDEARRSAGVEPGEDVILCVGAIEPRKAQIPLAQAFASLAERHPHAHLVFLGDWEDASSEALADYISSAPGGERVRLIQLATEIQHWYGIADFLVCPSDLESLPRAVLEAMAWGKPVLATDVFGLPDVVVDGVTGWLCGCRDVEELAAALERALGSSPAERAALGRAGRTLIEEHHTFKAYARRFAEILDGLVVGEDRLPPAGSSLLQASSNGAPPDPVESVAANVEKQ